MGKTFSTGLLTNGVFQDSSNNIGIGGAANASYKFQVTGATNLTDALTGTSATFERCAFVLPPILAPFAPANGIYLSNSNQLTLTTDSGQRLTIDYQGNVGIATMSPAYKLDVNGTGRFSGELTANSFVPTSSTIPSNGVYLPSANTLGFSTNSTLKMTITSGGNVSIGTTNSSARFNIQASANFETATLGTATGTMGYLSANGQYGMYIGIGNSGNTWLQSQRNDGNTSAYNLLLNPQGGNVGIGTSTPVTQLSITSLTPSSSTLDAIFNITNDIDANLRIFVTGSGSSDKRAAIGPTTNTALAFQTNSSERMRITSDGYVGIGTTTPATFKLSVVGDGNVVAISSSNNSLSLALGYQGTMHGYLGGISSRLEGYSNNGGYVYLSSSSTWIPASDIKRKRNFETYNLGLDAILGLKPKRYNMDFQEDGDEKQVGLIAQEVKECIPQAFEQSEEFIGINYNVIIVTLVKAIQELKAEIDQLKAS